MSKAGLYQKLEVLSPVARPVVGDGRSPSYATTPG